MKENRARRVLIVDDNASIHEDLTAILHGVAEKDDSAQTALEDDLFGGKDVNYTPVIEDDFVITYAIDDAYQGEEAVKMVDLAYGAGNPYELIFMDVRMPPGINGVETIKRIWDKHPEVQIILCTAYADYSWEDIQRSFGRTDHLLYVKKPFISVSIRQMAQTLTTKWALNRENEEFVANLKESEERYRTLVDNVGLGVMLVNHDLKIVMMNEKLRRMFPGVRIGQSCADLCDDTHPETQESQSCCPASQTFADGDMHETIVEKSVFGKTRILRIQSYPVRAGIGKISRAITVIEDITDRQNLEQRLVRAEKMESLGRMAGGVAHDLNNILSGLATLPDLLLLDIPEKDPNRGSLEIIRDSAKRAAAVVNDLLTISRQAVTEFSVLNINDIVSRFLQTPECGLIERDQPDIEIVTDLASAIPNIEGAEIHLMKVIMNLVTNAADAIKGAGTITLKTSFEHIAGGSDTAPNLEEGQYVVLKVSDTGHGIKKDDIARIFEPFYTKKAMGARSGTGLGLAIVWGAVTDHKGHIDVSSSVGEGTTFSLYFPATGKKHETPFIEDKFVHLKGHGEKILIVDDSVDQGMIASKVLEKLGYAPHIVNNGEKALEYLKSNDVAIVLLDMMLEKGMDGLDTFRKIIEFKPNQKALLVSGYSKTERAKEALRLGVGQFIKKPYEVQTIAAAVKEELEK